MESYGMGMESYGPTDGPINLLKTRIIIKNYSVL